MIVILLFILIGASVLAGYNEANLPVLINDLNCTGSEESVWECPHNGIVGYSCYHRGDAAMACTGTSIAIFFSLLLTVVHCVGGVKHCYIYQPWLNSDECCNGAIWTMQQYLYNKTVERSLSSEWNL